MPNIRFDVLEDFEDSGNQYCKGLSYTARTNELATKLPKWIQQKKVKYTRANPRSRVAGNGEVK